MFVFLIALKSRSASQDWRLTTKLLSQTLASIQNQTNPNYKIVVACNQKPDISATVDWVITDNDSPDLSADFYLKEKDRAKKLLIGYEYAKKYNPDYLMPVDADDFVNQNICDCLLHIDINFCFDSCNIGQHITNRILQTF